jgi:hypothetical protein
MFLNFKITSSENVNEARKIFIVLWIISLAALNFNFPYFLIFIVLFLSFLEFRYGSLKGLLILFFIFSFSIPYSFIHLTTGNKIGLIFNQYFFSGIPLYLGFIKIIFSKKSLRFISVNQRLLFIFLVCLFMITNILPGVLSLLGLGGHVVRTAFVFNYLNGLLVFFFIASIEISKNYILALFRVCSHIGLILAILALFQFFSGLPTFIYFEKLDLIYSRLFVYTLPDSIDGLMFLVFPLFYWYSLYKKRSSDFVSMIFYFILFFSLFLSFSRWALFSYLTTILSFTFLSIKKNISRVIELFKYIFMLVISLFFLFRLGLLDNQMNRLESNDNLLVRSYLWGLGVTAIEKAPFLGYGHGNSTNAMFQSESSYNFLNEENSTKSVETFTQMGVHQFLIDSALSQGVFLPLIFIYISIYIFFSLRPFLKMNDQVITIIFNSFIFLILFWMQNNGSQYFLIFSFWGIVASLKYQKKL